MKELWATLTWKNQRSVATEARHQRDPQQDDTGVLPGEDDGEVTPHMPQYVDIAALRGAAGTLAQPLSWAEIEQVAAEERAERGYGQALASVVHDERVSAA
jgi:hypothetical protein